MRKRSALHFVLIIGIANFFADFTYEPPRPHHEVLQLMKTCDVLVLPSIVEGRALVQQEAMSCRLPVIATRNAGADDLDRAR